MQLNCHTVSCKSIHPLKLLHNFYSLWFSGFSYPVIWHESTEKSLRILSIVASLTNALSTWLLTFGGQAPQGRVVVLFMF